MIRLMAWCVLAAGAPLFADGGAVVLHKESAPFVVTIFASPAPARAGIVDLSFLVQSSGTLAAALDADVELELSNSRSQVRVRATHEQARNKLFYSASVNLGEPGEWRYRASIRTARVATPVLIEDQIAIGSAQPKLASYGLYLALPFLWLALFALHQLLRWGKSATYPIG